MDSIKSTAKNFIIFIVLIMLAVNVIILLSSKFGRPSRSHGAPYRSSRPVHSHPSRSTVVRTSNRSSSSHSSSSRSSSRSNGGGSTRGSGGKRKF